MINSFDHVTSKNFENVLNSVQVALLKTELDVNLIHSYIASEAALHVNRPPRMEELSPSELDTQEK